MRLPHTACRVQHIGLQLGMFSSKWHRRKHIRKMLPLLLSWPSVRSVCWQLESFCDSLQNLILFLESVLSESSRCVEKSKTTFNEPCWPCRVFRLFYFGINTAIYKFILFQVFVLPGVGKRRHRVWVVWLQPRKSQVCRFLVEPRLWEEWYRKNDNWTIT